MPKKLICCSYCTVPQQGQASRRRALLVSQRHAAHAKLMHSQKSNQQQTLALVAKQVFLALKKELYLYPQEINSPKWLLCNTSLQHKVQTRNLHQPHPLEMLMIPDWKTEQTAAVSITHKSSLGSIWSQDSPPAKLSSLPQQLCPEYTLKAEQLESQEHSERFQS